MVRPASFLPVAPPADPNDPAHRRLRDTHEPDPTPPPSREGAVRSGELDPLRGSLADFASPPGANLMTRHAPLAEWLDARTAHELLPYRRTVGGMITPLAVADGADGRRHPGLNLASQDYLSLSSHPSVHAAAARAIRDYGVHSGGSAALQGGSDLSRQLADALREHLEMEYVVLFPTGWGAAFGAVTALVRPGDHIVLDRLAHASLRSGATAATRNVRRVDHADPTAVRTALAEIRATDATHGILVVTEGLFSMDSDSPDLAGLQAVCREYDATLLVDVAHDLGSLGPRGTGHLGREGLVGQVDLVMGSFSKTFASNGGFVASRHPGVRAAVEAYGGPHVFSNALSPVQSATVLEALRLVRSDEGASRRAQLEAVATALREALTGAGATVLGDVSAIVPVHVGHTAAARLAARRVLQAGVFANLVEFPAVGVRAARLRLQVQADHTVEQVQTAGRIVAEGIAAGHRAVS